MAPPRMSRRLDLYCRWAGAVRKARLFQSGERVAVAVSGGADSVLLLHFMQRLAGELGLRLAVVHFNHRLRGEEAEADEQFVRQQAERLGVDFIRGEADVAKVARERHHNLEATARELRYRFFFSLVSQGKVEKVVTAHTANDQAETVLLRLLRGSGARGLGGIYPLLAGKVTRPFLGLTRAEIEAELGRRQLDFRIDSSNRDPRFLRNRVRAELLPLLERNYNPQIVPLLRDLSDRARDDEAYLENQAAERARAWRIREGSEQRIPVRALAQFPPALARRALRQMIAAAQGHLRGITYRHIEALRRFALEGQSGRSLTLSHRLLARKEFDWLHVALRPPSPVPDSTGASLTRARYSYAVDIPGQVAVTELGLTFRFQIISRGEAGMAYNDRLDLSKLGGELLMRNWLPGDSLQPVGCRKARKVKELFQRHKIPLHERALWPVLESGSSVVWVRGFPPDRRAAASSITERAVIVVEEPLRPEGPETARQEPANA